jgi:hypothetical protein
MNGQQQIHPSHINVAYLDPEWANRWARTTHIFVIDRFRREPLMVAELRMWEAFNEYKV